MARSSFLVDRHPKDPNHRVAVLAPVNYVRDDRAHALAFHIEGHPFFHNSHLFDVGRVVEVEPDDVTMDDVLAGGESERERKRDAKLAAVLDALTDEPQSVRAIAEAVDVPRSTVQRLLEDLEDDGLAERVKGAGWVAVDQDDDGEDDEP